MERNFIDVLWIIFEMFYNAGEVISTKLTSSLLPQVAVNFLDSLIADTNLGEVIFQLLQINSFADITFIWGLGVGFFAVIVYCFISWIMNLIS